MKTFPLQLDAINYILTTPSTFLEAARAMRNIRTHGAAEFLGQTIRVGVGISTNAMRSIELSDFTNTSDRTHELDITSNIYAILVVSDIPNRNYLDIVDRCTPYISMIRVTLDTAMATLNSVVHNMHLTHPTEELCQSLVSRLNRAPLQGNRDKQDYKEMENLGYHE